MAHSPSIYSGKKLRYGLLIDFFTSPHVHVQVSVNFHASDHVYCYYSIIATIISTCFCCLSIIHFPFSCQIFFFKYKSNQANPLLLILQLCPTGFNIWIPHDLQVSDHFYPTYLSNLISCLISLPSELQSYRLCFSQIHWLQFPLLEFISFTIFLYHAACEYSYFRLRYHLLRNCS